MHPGLDPRTPVLIGGGQVNQRVDRGDEPLEPIDLLARALQQAAAGSGARDPLGMLAGADTVGVVNIISWRYRDPAALVAQRLGASPTRRWHTVASGSSPQQLLHQAARDIVDGQADLVVIGGAESWRTRTSARAGGERPEWTVQADDAEPTWTLGDDTPLVNQAEMGRGIVLPIQIYPLFESAVRAAAGRTPAEHMVHLSELWSRFSQVAATNPNAWIQQAYTAEQIRTIDAGNRMVGYPYPKLMNSNSAVEQGAGFVLCSAERADSLGIPLDRWVFPWSGAEAHDTLFVSNRTSFASSPAIAACGRAALAHAGRGVDDVAHVDLYSCFPSAVEVAADALGLAIDRQLTVTGGLSFAGGPWNNYVSHSLATMAELLRNDHGSLGLVSANGGFLTKHSIGLYSSEPPPAGFGWSSCQDDVDAAGMVELCESFEGPATVEACTVMHSREGEPENGIVAARIADGRRVWATSNEPAVMDALMASEAVGRPASIRADGSFGFE